METKISIKNVLDDSVLFEFSSPDNTNRKTVEAMLLKFCGRVIENANLSGMDLSGIIFYKSRFYNSRFDNSSFYNSRFDNSSFDNSRFYNSRFDNSLFDNSRFDNSSFDTKTIEAIVKEEQTYLLESYKNDFWAKLLRLKNEIPAFKKVIKEGKIDGSCYEGTCCCFCGTFAKIMNVDYNNLPGVKVDSNSPTEKWFMGIEKGMTPENSAIVKLTMQWIVEFELLIKKGK